MAGILRGSDLAIGAVALHRADIGILAGDGRPRGLVEPNFAGF